MKRDNLKQFSTHEKSACFCIYLIEVENWDKIECASCLLVISARR